MNEHRERQKKVVATDYQSMFLEAERELAIIDYELASESWELSDEDPKDPSTQED